MRIAVAFAIRAGPQSEFARRVAVSQQSVKLSAVGGAKIKADVSTSHPPFMPRMGYFKNSMSSVEHYPLDRANCSII